MWEYTVIDVPDEHYGGFCNALNHAGAQGWEFTGYTTDTGRSTEFLMKRPRKDSNE